jgi:heterodisulfide reductase subunit C
MFFMICLYISLTIFALGLLFKVSTWFRYTIVTGEREITPPERVYAAIKGIILTLFSVKILTLLKVFFLDVLFQVRILKESYLRWFMHICIFGGFMLLLLMHALDKFISYPLFAEYSSTINPFLFLRNLFFVIVLIGLAIAVYRRSILKVPRLMTNYMDHYVIIILAVIMFSGIFLEATKIGSFKSFQSMVDEYADSDDEEELRALESFWVEKFGVVSSNLKGPFDDNTLAQGKELHEMSCAACHSQPQWAFLSYGIAKSIKPIARGLDKLNIPGLLWTIHFLACFIGLAYLPFSKMFHIFASPLSLLTNAVMDSETSDPANLATKQIIEMDACTHCGTCSTRCAVGICFMEIPNVNILPSEKIASVKALVSGGKINGQALGSIMEGLYLCTNCYRCTVVCPVGINLQDLWFNVRESMLQKGQPELLSLSPFSLYRGLKRDGMGREKYEKPVEVARQTIADECRSILLSDTINQKQIDKKFKAGLVSSPQSNSYSYCFTCMTCTSACPVVWNVDNPPETLGLVPHQIIRAAVVGLPDLIFTSKMLWSCLGCYKCQEHCPQGVRVTDVFYELKNLAMKHVKGKTMES